jgi:lipopolysaccharide transport system permease protein
MADHTQEEVVVMLTGHREGQSGNLIVHLRTFWSFRELVWMWILRDIRIRYKQSLLGATWAVLQPLVLMIVFTVVFSVFAQVPTDGAPYPIFSYTALLPWTLLATSISFGVTSLVNNMSLVTKVYFPREILPLSAIGASFVDFAIASLVYLGLMIFYRVPFQVTLLAVPILLAVQVTLAAGVILFASAANVFYRDIRFVVPLAMQVWMYATPIIYPLSLVPERFRMVYMLNPMAGLIESYRAVALYGQWPDWRYLGIAAAVSVVIFGLGYAYFKQVEWQFADVI